MKRRYVFLTAFLCCCGLLASLLIYALPGPFIGLCARNIEKRFDLAIDFTSHGKRLLGKWRLEDVRILSASGCGITVEDLLLDPSLGKLPAGTYEFKCLARNLKFNESLPLIESACDLLSIDAPDDIIFDTTEADVILGPTGVEMRRLKAYGRDLRLTGQGRLEAGLKTLDYRLKFFYRDNSGWNGVDFDIDGSYKRPRLKLKSDLFELNIERAIVR